ncbi:MAG: hypothetical protein WCP89_03060 [archaeon]
MIIRAEYIEGVEFASSRINVLRLHTDFTREQMRPLLRDFSPFSFHPMDVSEGEDAYKGQVSYMIKHTNGYSPKECALILAKRISTRSGLEIDVSKLQE